MYIHIYSCMYVSIFKYEHCTYTVLKCEYSVHQLQWRLRMFF